MAIALINILNKPLSAATLAAITEMLGPLPSLVLAPVPVYTNIVIPSVWWIVGFVCGEGSFSYLTRSRTTASGEQRFDFSLIFEVSQALSDKYQRMPLWWTSILLIMYLFNLLPLLLLQLNG